MLKKDPAKQLSFICKDAELAGPQETARYQLTVLSLTYNLVTLTDLATGESEIHWKNQLNCLNAFLKANHKHRKLMAPTPKYKSYS